MNTSYFRLQNKILDLHHGLLGPTLFSMGLNRVDSHVRIIRK
jgi:hypothetical protein